MYGSKISDYMQGSLGKVLIGLIVLVGLAAAVVRQSLMSLAVAVGGAISLYYSPDIINGMMAASHAVQNHFTGIHVTIMDVKKNRLWPVFLHLIFYSRPIENSIIRM
mgnify:CR=1 FL=1